ncbi:MAG: hypothetical protein L6R37_005148 [Teloschistes peruensis]|nr:MAG: hypothetical protein L6R37_005148 [Teloschistes peruensis]
MSKAQQPTLPTTMTKTNGDVEKSRPRPRRRSMPWTVLTSIGIGLNRVFSLLVPRDWSRRILIDILNETDPELRTRLVNTFIDSEITKMNTTGVTAALIAAVISSSFSWYNIEDTTWPTRAAWFSGLVLSIASVASSAIHTAAFLRMKCDRDIPERFRHALGKYKDYDGQEPDMWKPHVLIPYVLGGPTLHLKLAVLAFLIGLFYELWRAANDAMLTWHGEHLKIAFVVTLVGGFVVINYIFSIWTLVHRSIHPANKP